MPSPRHRLWIDRSIRLIVSAGAILVTGVVSVVRNKWLAVHIAASGLGTIAQVVSAQNWLGTAAALGLGFPLGRTVGEALGRGDERAAARTFWTAITLTTVSTIVATAAGLLFAPALSRALLGSPEYAPLVRISMIGLAGFALSATWNGLFAGRSDLEGPLVYAIVGGAASVAAVFFLVPRWGLSGAVLAISVMYPIGLVGALALRHRAYAPAFTRPTAPWFDSREARALLGVAGAALVLSLLDLGTLLAIRSSYLRANGVAANGLLQAALALSQQVGSVFYAYLARYAFGKVSAAAADGGEGVGAYTRRQWTPLLLVATLAIGFTMAAAAPLLHLLYSSRFDPARPMMAYTLFGEFCRVAVQAWALGALPLAGTGLWFAIGVSQPLSVAALYALFASRGVGEMSLPYAYASAGLVTLLVAIVGMRSRGVSMGKREGIALLGALAFLFVLLRVFGS
jgi:O-antigen/teichoic acid export membrane protein